MTKEEIFDYISETPENTNFNILGQMLDEFGGGGNSNYVETIEGTLENPYGTIDVVSLAHEIQNGNATVTLAFDAESKSWMLLGIVNEIYDEGDYASVMFRYADFISKMSIARGRFNAAFVMYETEIGETSFLDDPYVVVDDGQSSTAYDVDTDTSCTLTIIHHPLPSGS